MTAEAPRARDFTWTNEGHRIEVGQPHHCAQNALDKRDATPFNAKRLTYLRVTERTKSTRAVPVCSARTSVLETSSSEPDLDGPPQLSDQSVRLGRSSTRPRRCRKHRAEDTIPESQAAA